MTVPDYIISQTIVTEHQQRQAQQAPNTDLPHPQRRRHGTSTVFARVRLQLSDLLSAFADRIEPRPAVDRR